MNLQTTISVYSGGPGSGRHKEAGTFQYMKEGARESETHHHNFYQGKNGTVVHTQVPKEQGEFKIHEENTSGRKLAGSWGTKDGKEFQQRMSEHYGIGVKP